MCGSVLHLSKTVFKTPFNMTHTASRPYCPNKCLKLSPKLGTEQVLYQTTNYFVAEVLPQQMFG